MKLLLFATLMIVTASDRLGQPQSQITSNVFSPNAVDTDAELQNIHQSPEGRQLRSKFRLRLYWEKGYRWQNSSKEKKWWVVLMIVYMQNSRGAEWLTTSFTSVVAFY